MYVLQIFVYLCPFSFGHCVDCPSIYRFWLPLWYLQTRLKLCIHVNKIKIYIYINVWRLLYLLVYIRTFFITYISPKQSTHIEYALLINTVYWTIYTKHSFTLMMFNDAFNSISVISWWSVLLVEEAGVLWGHFCLVHLMSNNNIIVYVVFNFSFNNISIISWQSVLLVEESGVPRENQRPVTSHIMLYPVYLAIIILKDLFNFLFCEDL